MRLFFLVGLLSLALTVRSQTPSRSLSPVVWHLPADSSLVYTYALQMPQLRGGGYLPAITKRLEHDLGPAAPGTPAGGGRVLVEFLVGPSGRLYQPAVLRSLSPEWDRKAVAAIRRLAVLAPGVQRGKRVPVLLRLWLTVPVPVGAAN